MDPNEDIDDGLDHSSPNQPPPIRPACDSCRLRKVRCDRQDPCSHCVAAKIDCTVINKKPREKRTRILVTPQYEKKIDRLDRRLGEVLGLIQELKIDRQLRGTSQATFGGSQPSTTSSPMPNSSIAIKPGTSAILGVAGGSSLAAHSAFANDFMHHIANSDSLQSSGSEMSDTLGTLSNVVASLREQAVVSEMTYPHARPMQRPSLVGSELPPIQKAVELIRIAKNQRLVGTGLIYQFIAIRDFSDICLQVYFSNVFTETDFIIVNAGLHSLFGDYSYRVSGDERLLFVENARLCRSNLETALNNLPFHMPTTSDTVTALLFGAWHAIELSKPYLSWSLSAKAAELCQTLGYHRMTSTAHGDDAKFTNFLFWTNYFIDKSLSLRLGRASTIPDWDITTRRPSATDPHTEPVWAYFALWTETARCQGNIYELLYSPEAIVQPQNVWQSRAEILANSMQILEQATQDTHKRWMQVAMDKSGKDLMDFFATSDEILRLSLLTLVHRANLQPAGSLTTFSPACIEAARATLLRHQDCMAIIQRSKEDFLPLYVHWTLLFAPFVPFIVVFCRIIETKDKTDLACLGTFVASIQPAADASDAAAKLHRLFQVLHNVASRYVALNSLDSEQPGVNQEMDMFLNFLCMPPPGEAVGGDQHRQGFTHDLSGNIDTSMAGSSVGHVDAQSEGIVLNPIMRMGHGVQLEEWLYNNQALMESFQTFSNDFPAEE